jgi:hypothetical protein
MRQETMMRGQEPGCQQWRMKEFEYLRLELNNRIDFLHKTITLAVIFWLVLFITVFQLILRGLSVSYLITYLLFVPIIFDLLGYNYQSNQNSLESIPKYIHEVIRLQARDMSAQDVLGWEKFFAMQKVPFKFESTFKVFPFVLPSAIPFVLLAMRVSLNPFQQILVWVDIIFLVFLLESFRYKFRRVK